MSDVTGPIHTLPGASHAVPPGAMCDEHPKRPAVARIQGETDSFGAELIDCCEECRDALRAAIQAPEDGWCDWCKTMAKGIRDHRDFEEGSSGPVYSVCAGCRAREQQRLERELDYYDRSRKLGGHMPLQFKDHMGGSAKATVSPTHAYYLIPTRFLYWPRLSNGIEWGWSGTPSSAEEAEAEANAHHQSSLSEAT